MFETSTCCIVLMVDDEVGDGAEIMLLSQVKVSLWSGADVIMPAACTSVSVESVVRVSQQVFHRTRAANMVSVIQNTAVSFCGEISPGFA